MAIIVITGTSTGIGYATAETLARNGHTVYATMRNPGNQPQLQELADREHLPINIHTMDVLEEDAVTDVMEMITKKEGQIDVLINNAGVGCFGSAEELSMDMIRRDMETNYFGSVRCIKAVLPQMRERRSGTIVNVSSVAGKVYSNFHGAYCASKAAVEAFSESLAQEVAPFNIRVAIVQPGVTETPIFNKANDYPVDIKYPNFKRFMSLFAASLENHTPPSIAANVIKDIVEGKSNDLRYPAGPDAAPLLGWRTSLSDTDWINSVNIDDDTWIEFMEQNMGLQVRKYMQKAEIPVLSV